MIRSSPALLITLALIVANGYVKSLLVPNLPYETMVTGIVAVFTGYMTKRVVQKMRGFNRNEQVNCDEQDV